VYLRNKILCLIAIAISMFKCKNTICFLLKKKKKKKKKICFLLKKKKKKKKTPKKKKKNKKPLWLGVNIKKKCSTKNLMNHFDKCYCTRVLRL